MEVKTAAISFDLINGLAFGVEHLSPDEDDDFKWIISMHLAFIRVSYIKF